LHSYSETSETRIGGGGVVNYGVDGGSVSGSYSFRNLKHEGIFSGIMYAVFMTSIRDVAIFSYSLVIQYVSQTVYCGANVLYITVFVVPTVLQYYIFNLRDGEVL